MNYVVLKEESQQQGNHTSCTYCGEKTGEAHSEGCNKPFNTACDKLYDMTFGRIGRAVDYMSDVFDAALIKLMGR
jgi:hypothetical protein